MLSDCVCPVQDIWVVLHPRNFQVICLSNFLTLSVADEEYSTCRQLIPVLSLYMHYHRVCNSCNTTGLTSVTGTAYTSGAPEVIPGILCSSCCLTCSFPCYVGRSFVSCLPNILSVLLQCTDSNYPFDIFKFFLSVCICILPLFYAYTKSMNCLSDRYTKQLKSVNMNNELIIKLKTDNSCSLDYHSI